MVTGPLLLALLSTFGMFQSAMAFSFVYISILSFFFLIFGYVHLMGKLTSEGPGIALYTMLIDK